MTIGNTKVPMKTTVIIVVTVTGWVLGVAGFIYSVVVAQNDRIAANDKLTALNERDVAHLEEKVEVIDQRTQRIENNLDAILRVYNIPKTQITSPSLSAQTEIMTRIATST